MAYEKKSPIVDLFVTTLTGNIGKKQDMKFLPSGDAVLNFSVAVSNDYKDKQGDINERTVWLDCSIWGAYAEAMNDVLGKAKTVAIMGRLQPARAWKSDDGEAKASIVLKVDSMRITSWKDDDGSQSGNGGSTKSRGRQQPDDDIPF